MSRTDSGRWRPRGRSETGRGTRAQALAARQLLRGWTVLALLLATALVLGGCATTGGPRVHTDSDPAASFDGYRSFGFAQPLGTDRQGYQTLVSQRLKAAAQREMEARGYRYVEDGADLLVNFGARLDEKTRVRSTPEPAFGGWYGWRHYDTWLGYRDRVDVREYEQGTLTIDLVDARRKQLVWSATVVGEVNERTLENLDAAIAGAVATAFRRYPHRAGAGT